VCSKESAITSIPDAQAGRYSTKINVHNNTGLPINFRKKFIKLIGSEGGPELFERATDPQAKVFESLNEDQAMEVGVCLGVCDIIMGGMSRQEPWLPRNLPIDRSCSSI
jgi:hypothetical protein